MFPVEAPNHTPITLPEAVLRLPIKKAREAFEREYLRVHLERCGGNVMKLSRVVLVERTHLYRKMRVLGVKWEKPPVDLTALHQLHASRQGPPDPAPALLSEMTLPQGDSTNDTTQEGQHVEII